MSRNYILNIRFNVHPIAIYIVLRLYCKTKPHHVNQPYPGS